MLKSSGFCYIGVKALAFLAAPGGHVNGRSIALAVVGPTRPAPDDNLKNRRQNYQRAKMRGLFINRAILPALACISLGHLQILEDPIYACPNPLCESRIRVSDIHLQLSAMLVIC